MGAKEEEEFLKLLGLKGTRDILMFLDEQGAARHHQLAQFISMVTLYTRLQQLLMFNLIQHHLDKKNVRKEWYEITERGKKVLECMEALMKLLEG